MEGHITLANALTVLIRRGHSLAFGSVMLYTIFFTRK